MTLLFAIPLIILVLLLALMQTLLVLAYRWFLRDANESNDDKETGSDDDQLPSTAIILCLRGFEEGIPDCLAELIGQNYPNYELHIAFDSHQDSAVQQVQSFFEDKNFNVQLHFFSALPNCSYKCSGIVHTLNQLDEKFEVVAFCDGDAIVDEYWLRDLVSPIVNDRQIGATTGNRWFDPTDVSTGALVRKHWNAAAIVQMQAYDIAWGGSMAVRRNVIEECGLTEIWSKSFCEDTGLTEAIVDKGLRLQRVPNLIVENNESATVPESFHWIARQLLTVRLHHKAWPLVMTHGLVTGLATMAAPIVAIAFLACGYFVAGRSLLIAWLVYQALNVLLLMLIERCNQEALGRRESTVYHPIRKPPLRWRILSLVMVQVLHPLAVIRAMRMKSVEWRGIEYQIEDQQIKVASVSTTQ
jgi:cellulose synthase/poly-beta-1,6-N-acetylglucosamine synthase-like glycosyltransferase